MTTLEALRTTSPESRRTRTELTELTGLCDRAVREQIEQLRRDGIQIVSDTVQGGYYIADNDTWNRFCERERVRAVNTFKKQCWANERQVRV